MTQNSSIKILFSNRDEFSIPSKIEIENKIYSIDDECIGRGGAGCVFKCMDSNGNEYAIKFVNLTSRKFAERFLRECEFLKICEGHPHIISYIASGEAPAEIHKTHRGSKISRMGKLSYCLMELADGGNLRDLINSEISVPFSIYSAQIRGLSSALECLHGKNILHRDIKPENILIKGERWLLSDFGLTAPFVRDDQIDLTRHDEKIGPKFWLSPEATNKALGIHGVHSELGKHSDVFQLASVFWYVVNKRHPLGVVGSDDWTGKNEIYEVLYGALLHNPATRIADGSAFHQRIVDAIEA